MHKGSIWRVALTLVALLDSTVSYSSWIFLSPPEWWSFRRSLSRQKTLPLSSRPSHTRLLCLTPASDDSTATATATTKTTTTTTTLDEILPTKSHCSCRVCHQTFHSRNALFRHLQQDHSSSSSSSSATTCVRGSDASSVVPGDTESTTNPPTTGTTTRIVPFRLAVQFGYCYVGTCTNLQDSSSTSAAQTAAFLLEQDIRNSTQQPTHNTPSSSLPWNKECSTETLPKGNVITAIRLLSSTQSSGAKLRPHCLQQDNECAAIADVLVFSGELWWTHQHCRSDDDATNDFLTNSSTIANAWTATLAKRWNKSPFVVDSDPPLQIQVQALKLLSPGTTLHAERACTQYVYHYLLPLSWLQGDNCTEWIVRHRNLSNSMTLLPATTTDAAGPPPPSLVRLKRALRSAENPRRSPPPTRRRDTAEEDPRSEEPTSVGHLRLRPASGRFGGLAFKWRRPWHNLCDPTLMGQAAPNQEAVWRCIDRARIGRFLHHNNNNNDTTAVIEVRGDAFLRHQVRYIVGTALAMANQWLPMDTFDICTKSDATLAPSPHMPCAPTGRMYLASTRFHFEEMVTSGRPWFESHTGGCVTTVAAASPDPMEWMETTLWQQRRAAELQQQEYDWLEHVHRNVCPAACAFLNNERLDPHERHVTWPTSPFAPPPPVYHDVLRLLRDIQAQGTWPETSVARSTVLRTQHSKALMECSEETLTKNSGSFTVVNPLLIEKSSFPLGNHLFPSLVQHVFELERELIQGSSHGFDSEKEAAQLAKPLRFSRLPSSHCAINCNAEFLPHVDSGRGAGQTLSLIVGLGDYRGGELSVETETWDIRYAPLEFDGWKMRHWTRKFVGERFSLVWFTPE